MKLQILVNHYKEDNYIVSRFLSSLEMQKMVDFEVLIYTDGGVKLDLDFLHQFNLKITYKYLPHKGVCHTRNQLLDDATADYVVFCDIDDCFSSFDGLFLLVQAIEKTNADAVYSPYQSEKYIKGEYQYNTLYRDGIRIHGKIFRRQYLIDKQIRFPDELETSGDMMFMWLAGSLADTLIWIPENFYIWKYNPQSVTRYDTYATVYQLPRTIKCYTLLAYSLIDRRRKDLFDTLVAGTVAMIFLESTTQKWIDAPKEAKKSFRLAAKDYLLEFYEYYKQLPNTIKLHYFSRVKTNKHYYITAKDYSYIDEWANEILKDVQQQKEEIQ